jgi:RNA polymerase sigma-70 factor (ECF subfamily)
MGRRIGCRKLDVESLSLVVNTYAVKPDARLGPEFQPFEEIYRLHHAGVFHFCRLQIGDRVAAEDATADIFMKAFRAYDTVRPVPVEPWLYRIARNTLIDRGRYLKRWSRLTVALFDQRSSATVEETSARREEVQAVLDGMKKLKPRDRELLGLRIVTDLSFEELGQIVGMKGNSVEAAVRRARAKLAGLLQREESPAVRVEAMK